MRLLSGWIILFSIMVFAAPGFAQMYQFTDQDGNIRFTDNLANIPEAQRDAVETMAVIESAIEEGQTAEEAPSEQPPYAMEVDVPLNELPDNTAEAADNTAEDDQFRAARESLEAERAEIEALYQQIEAEKNSLGAPPSEPASRLDRRVYEQNALDLNRRIEDYQARMDAYRKRLEAFNVGDPRKAIR